MCIESNVALSSVRRLIKPADFLRIESLCKLTLRLGPTTRCSCSVQLRAFVKVVEVMLISSRTAP